MIRKAGKSAKKPTSPTKRLLQVLAENVSFVPECGKEYHVNVTCRMLVRDCEIENGEESKAMGKCLTDKGKAAAAEICELNPNCPDPVLVSPEITRNECKGRQWDVDVRWTFRCLRLV